MKKDGNGICMFAYNNEQLDYVKFATLAAKYVKKNMKNNQTCLITNDGSYDWMKTSIGQKEIDRTFDYVVIQELQAAQNMRVHFDSPWTEFNAQFSNTNKHLINEYTPFERTLLIDTDFLVMNDFYDYIFDTDVDISMHRYAEYLGGQPPYQNEITLNPGGINHWWSTVVYFDQSPTSKLFFDIWSHVKDNWEYYSLLYQFNKSLFRTDYCVSIAAHMFNGFNNDDFVHDFLGLPLLTQDQKDDIVKFNDINDIVFLKHNRAEPWKNTLVRHTNDNLHVMNKRSLDRQINVLLKEFGETNV